jgi:HlyD family secretion protein
MAEERKQIGRVWLWLGAAILLGIVFFVARTLTREKLPVHAAAATRNTLVATISNNGLVEPERNVEYRSPLASTVRLIDVQQGDHVRAGKLLMQLDDITARARVATAESALRAAQATDEATRQGGTQEERQSFTSGTSRARLDLEQAQRELDALQKLQATGASSPSEVAAARQRVALAQDTLKSDEGRQTTRYSPGELARANSAVADAQANLAAARAVLQNTSFRAPSDGTVYSIPVSHGDFVEEGKLLLQMADLRHVRVRAYFDEPEIGSLAVGQKVRIIWDARLGKEWHGHIIQLPSTIIVYNTRNVGEVLVAIDDSDDGLLPDTHVTVTVTTSSEPNVLTIPREALHSENGNPYVFRIVNGDLVRTAIHIGTPNLTEVPVVSGLNDGDIVATTSINGLPLEDGAPVKVVR